MVEDIKERVVEEMKEEQEQKLKKNNLVIYRLNESKCQDVVDREKDDKQMCEKIMKDELKVEDVNIVQVIRLGKVRQEDNAPRPLLVKMRDAREKYAVLKVAKNLKRANSESMRRTIIAPDLTKKQREQEKMLRMQLKEKMDNGDYSWYIRNGKLCKKSFF